MAADVGDEGLWTAEPEERNAVLFYGGTQYNSLTNFISANWTELVHCNLD